MHFTIIVCLIQTLRGTFWIFSTAHENSLCHFCSLVTNTALMIHSSQSLCWKVKSYLKHFLTFVVFESWKSCFILFSSVCVCLECLAFRILLIRFMKLLIYFHFDININLEHLFQIFRRYYFQDALKVILHICIAMRETGSCIWDMFMS